MNKQEVKFLFDKFITKYNEVQKNKESIEKEIWEKQRKRFKEFWNKDILDDGVQLTDKKVNEILRMIDIHVSGFNSKVNRAVADTGIRPNILRKIISNIKYDKIVGNILDKIFRTENDDNLISMINKLVKYNGRKGVTSPTFAVLNALLFINKPLDKFLPIANLKHRLKIIEVFGLGNLDNVSDGEKIVQSNYYILNGFRDKYDIYFTPYTVVYFLYSEDKRRKNFFGADIDVYKLWRNFDS